MPFKPGQALTDARHHLLPPGTAAALDERREHVLRPTDGRPSVCRRMSAGTPLVGGGQLDQPYAMDNHLLRRRAVMRSVATLATVTALFAAAPAGAQQPDPVMVNFDALTTTGDGYGGQALGTFTMTGARSDTGTVRIAYRLFGRRIDATATLMGAKGILAIGLRATMAPVLNDHRSAVGRWGICGGTGPYRRLAGQGDWTALVDVLAAPAGSLPRALHGAYIGRTYRSSALRRASSSRDVHC